MKKREPAPERTTYRLNQFIARCGVGSRRKADELIAQGLVRVNDRVVEQPGVQIDPTVDRVKVRGEMLLLAGNTTIVFSKPKGVVCTRKDPQERRTIYDLLPAILLRKAIQSIGRLDFDSRGLLILTNDGDLHQAMEHPSGGVKRTYRVKARGFCDLKTREKLLEGVELEDGPAQVDAIEVSRISGGISRFEVTLSEGRNREVRRLCSAVGLEVLDLKRTRFGAVRLDDLPSGKWREPTFREQAFFEKIKRRVARES